MTKKDVAKADGHRAGASDSKSPHSIRSLLQASSDLPLDANPDDYIWHSEYGYKEKMGRPAKVGPVVELEEGRHIKTGKKLRKAFERPRPDLPSDAPINRNRKQIAVTLPPDLIKDVSEEASRRDMDRNRLVELALRMLLNPK